MSDRNTFRPPGELTKCRTPIMDPVFATCIRKKGRDVRGDGLLIRVTADDESGTFLHLYSPTELILSTAIFGR